MVVPDRSFPNGNPVCDYWLGHCEGFAVRAGHRTLGVVERIHHGESAQTIVLRRNRRLHALDLEDVLAVVPARQTILVRRREHARPAFRIAWRSVRRFYSAAQPEVVRLARLTAAEIRARNRQRTAPLMGREHRAANRYTFALRGAQQPVRRGRNVGPTFMR